MEIEVSELMSSSKYVNENKSIRLSKKLRVQNNLNLYSFINLETVGGLPICLQILPAYTEDVDKNSDALFVTKSTYDILKKEINCTQLKVIDSMTLGCDPEALLIKDGSKLVKASNYFKKIGEVGNDGHILEFRPPPSIDERVVRDTLYSLIKRARTYINEKIPEPGKIRIIGSSYRKGNRFNGELPFYVTGFHLHFGIPPRLIAPGIPQIKELIKQVVKVLDYYVGIPSIILEKDDDAFRRSSIDVTYGKPGDNRLSFPTLEYRVPGGYSLKHPVLSCGLIGLGAVVIEDAITRIKEITNGFTNLLEIQTTDDIREIYPNLPQTTEIFKLIMSPNTDRAKTYLDKIYKDINKMVTFSNRKQSICDYFDAINSDKKISNDIEQNWENYYGSK